jgi:hypothetical protein
MMTATELEALAEDIAENGQRHDIVLYQGAVLDGRNRLLACEKAGVDPRFTEYEGDDAGALALVISLNVQRRDLTAAQRAVVAARTLPLFEEAARKRQETGKSVDGEAGGRGRKKTSGQNCPEVLSAEQAGKPFKVSGTYVKQAKALLAEAADLVTQVVGCSLSLTAAYEQLQDRRQQTKQKAKDAERIAEYADAISGGEMSFEEALQKAIEHEREEQGRVTAEADARRNWLKEFVEHVSWFEKFLYDKTDERLKWYTAPDSPGLFDHGMTAARLSKLVAHLQRAQSITFGEKHGKIGK